MKIADLDQGVINIARPAVQTAPVVLASPHSGRIYPPDLRAISPLDTEQLRLSEDCFVDDLFAGAPDQGVPLLRALFARAYVDVNREPYELDPRMFNEPLPNYANPHSPLVAAGLGTIARVVAHHMPIYRGRIALDTALDRVERCYRPYHRALAELIDTTVDRFKVAVLLDCHSMPSRSGGVESRALADGADVVLGDRHGTACGAIVTTTVEAVLQDLGYRVRRNHPYAGGFSTRHYGRPFEGRHALQIEISRALYMDEARLARSPAFAQVQADMGRVVAAVAALAPEDLRPMRRR